MKHILLISIPIFISFYTKAIDNLKERYYNVEKVEIYTWTNSQQELIDVKYFEGKLIIGQDGYGINCISSKTNKEYLKFKYLTKETYEITSSFFETCKGAFDINNLQQKEIIITLKDKDFILTYYLTQLFTDIEIYSKITSGTGILINKNSILTNYHVVNSSQKITIEFENTVIGGSIIKSDAGLDIAIIKSDTDIPIGNQLLNFANYKIIIGKLTYACGFPLLNSMGKQLKITSGIISSLTGFNDDDKYLQTTAPIDPGNSGGPLLDEYGNIIGIISAKHSLGTNVGYALKINFLLKKNSMPTSESKKLL